MKISDITSVIEDFAAPELQEEYDNAGLITGMPQWECSGVLCTLDATVDVVLEASARGCNLVLAHHPIVFRGMKRINGFSYVEKALIAAIKNDIAIYAAHTNLDNVIQGVNGKMAEKLELRNVTVLQPKKGMLRKLISFAPADHAEAVRNALFAAGAGQIGKYSECSFNSEGVGTFRPGEGTDPFKGKLGERHHEKETRIEVIYPSYLEEQVVRALLRNHPYEEVAYDLLTLGNLYSGMGAGAIGRLESPVDEKEFLKLLGGVFNARGLRHTALLGKPIQKVALCGGAGSFLIREAARAGADIYITSDVKYHEFFDAEGRILVADIGHYESEQFTTDLLHDLLVEKFPNFAVLKSGVNTNPVQYFR